MGQRTPARWAAVLVAAGPELLDALRSKLATTSRRVGEAVITDSFNMRAQGVLWIAHIISIIKNTPQGAYCPNPPRLCDGVASALQQVTALGAKSIAISALGTGEGRVAPDDAAKLMLGGVKQFRSQNPTSLMEVTFSLPNYTEYEAFASQLAK
jgi:O-acetyl-ADP-ribose deacetylase (regulator of RNase III)